MFIHPAPAQPEQDQKLLLYKVMKNVNYCLNLMLLSAILLSIGCANEPAQKAENVPDIKPQSITPAPSPSPSPSPTPVPSLGTAMGGNNRIDIGLSFVADQAFSGNYSGPTSATGFLETKQLIVCNTNITIPVGIYTANSVVSGAWTGVVGSAIVHGLEMEANGIRFVVGPGSGTTPGIINPVSPSRFGPSGEEYPRYLAGDVLIQSVNGQPCNTFGSLVESIN